MTPLQRRRQNTAMSEVAIATHKRYLGRPELLTGIQSAWIKSLLTVWGESQRGEVYPRKPAAHSCWWSVKGERWSDKALERFTAAIEQARAEGFRGPNALKRAQVILWPKQESSVIDTAISNDDADFMEKCVLDAFEVTDPIYIVGMNYYTTRKKISDITRELQKLAPWLTADQSRERVKWCLKIFQGKAFLAARKNLRS
ncbi:TPA: hypothetical protein N3Z59_000188 [Klebsiella pneumoniae]|uniref:hypothetical protein n=1 Tax=Klebsiella pneumoniae TaxID=573 RepID=UPI000E2A7B51|nr:hypothetical protein [Klebsiella pneumoniae]MBK0611468.1 hypothetical protein [Klebsiella pneumoniae]MBK4885646.1 hypothetical protein [Klebsiella pneumoniae]MBZ1901917.1 hypothetical protein [Klebsiella pneumoniae]SXT11909.1 Uncharacterised protein [Klebsiella pneumoniae]SXV82535.1 Uncharacterised protein [Klebsiella pneumoniae]